MDDKAKTLYIVIGCDTDPDRQGFIDIIPGNKLSWRGMTEGIPDTKLAVMDIKDSGGKSPVFTWLMRADDQINIIYGAYNWVLENYKGLIEDLEKTGDEIGWHPHFYKHNDKHGIWYQELKDVSWQCRMLESAHKSFGEIFPGKPRSVRTGWLYHNNETMKKLDELGLKIDFSAVPGLRTNPVKKIKFHYNIYDWFSTGKECYHPSEADYRRAAREGERELSILEVPNFTSHSWFWGMVSGFYMAGKMKDPVQIIQAIRKPTFWVSLSAGRKWFSPIIKSLAKELRRPTESDIFFITYFHPDELIENRSKIYNRDNLKRNLKSIINLSDRLEIPHRYIRAEDIPLLISE
ncbi:MAG: hypothetical protein JSW64_14960 [Candidatus Zixiibacteriota bacterium]|nr:MAG: hypothetical protein JSW64_14960 [candidate division Zixibacteria bacterium]